MNRRDMLSKLQEPEKVWDMVVVGGGATGLGAVSYTHLDVYKRQQLNCSTPLKLSTWRRDEGGGTSEVAVKCIDITWNPDSEGSFPGSI